MKKSLSIFFALSLLCAFLTPVYADLVWTDENGEEHYGNDSYIYESMQDAMNETELEEDFHAFVEDTEADAEEWDEEATESAWDADETTTQAPADEAAAPAGTATKTTEKETKRSISLLPIVLVACVMLVTGAIIIVLSRKNKRAKAAGSAPATANIPNGAEAPAGQENSFQDPTEE